MRKALAFLTPFGEATGPTPGALAWFPPVGAMIGFAVGGIWWLADKAWPAAAAAAVALAADVALTGYLHLDGLADTADGILPPLEHDQRLAAMSDPAVGAFGMVTVGVVLLLRFGAFASTRAAPLVVASLWCGVRRTAMAVVREVLSLCPSWGFGSRITSRIAAPPTRALSRRDEALWFRHSWAWCSVSASRLGHQACTLWPRLGLKFLAAGAVALFSRRRIGGFTGDVLGAAGVIGETVGLLVLAAKW